MIGCESIVNKYRLQNFLTASSVLAPLKSKNLITQKNLIGRRSNVCNTIFAFAAVFNVM